MIMITIFDMEGCSYWVAIYVSMAVSLQHNLGAKLLIGNGVIALQLKSRDSSIHIGDTSGRNGSRAMPGELFLVV